MDLFAKVAESCQNRGMLEIKPLIFKDRDYAHYNAAAWKDTIGGNTLCILREVATAAEEGVPDKGKLVLLEVDPQGAVVYEQVIWDPKDWPGKDVSLEDPRALVLPDGKVVIGLSSVEKEGEEYRAYPAITVLGSTSRFEKLPPIHVFHHLGPGKNTTPLNDNNFIFRKDGEHENHRLYVVEWYHTEAKIYTTIEFSPTIPWLSHRMGTTVPPIWVNDSQALMLIHGIEKQGDISVYSLGRAKLEIQDGEYKAIVDPKPILTPDDFLDNDGKPLYPELHPDKRRVVYVTGGVLENVGDQIGVTLFVNVGDRETVEVHFPFKELMNGWW